METASRYLLTFLVNSFWQISLIVAVAMLASRLMRTGPASHRHALWAAALIAGVLLPLASIRTSQQRTPMRLNVAYAPHPPAGTPSAAAASSTVSARPAASGAASIAFAQNSAAALLIAYLAFVLFRLVRFLFSWTRTVRLRRAARARDLTPLVERVHARCMAAFGSHDVDVLASARLTTPVTVGAARPSILVPEALFEETSEDVLTSAIGHEMAHIARRDFAWNLLYELAYVPISFHPAAWLIRRRIDQTREVACDELVVRRLIDPGVYARSIMTIAAATVAPLRPGYTLGVFDGDILEERVRRLLDRRPVNLQRARLGLVSGLAVLAVCVVAASGLALSARAQSASSAEMKMAGDAYNSGDFKSAVQHFENAVSLDPANVSGKLFLANALIREFFARNAAPDSPLLAQARQQYLDILAREPREKLAIQGMISISTSAGQMREARKWALELIQSDAADKTAYYTAGVLDWAIVYPEFIEAKQAAGVPKQEYFIPDAMVRKNLRGRFAAQIQEGISMLRRALQIDPDDADAMAYMNLLQRLESGMAETTGESANLIANADSWVGKALAAKRRQAQSQPPPAAQLDVEGPPPGPPGAHAIVAAPPPPPPPPPPPAR